MTNNQLPEPTAAGNLYDLRSLLAELMHVVADTRPHASLLDRVADRLEQGR